MYRKTGWTLFGLGGVAGLTLMYMLQGLDAGLVYTPIGACAVFVVLVLIASTLIKRAEHESSHLLTALLGLFLPSGRRTFLSSFFDLLRRGGKR